MLLLESWLGNQKGNSQVGRSRSGLLSSASTAESSGKASG